MPLPKYASRRDANEGEIVDFLRTFPGVSDVERVNERGEPDLRFKFLGKRRRAEVKTVDGDFTPAQMENLPYWEQEGVAILRTIDDVAAWLTRIMEGES